MKTKSIGAIESGLMLCQECGAPLQSQSLSIGPSQIKFGIFTAFNLTMTCENEHITRLAIDFDEVNLPNLRIEVMEDDAPQFDRPADRFHPEPELFYRN